MKTVFRILKLSFYASPVMFIVYLTFCITMPFLSYIPKLFAERELVNYLISSVDKGSLPDQFIIWLVIFCFSSILINAIRNGLHTYMYYSFAPKTERLIAGITNRKIYNMKHDLFYDNEFHDNFERIKNNRHSVHIFAANFLSEVIVQPITIITISGIVIFYEPIAIFIFMICNILIMIFNSKFTKKKLNQDKELAPDWRKNSYYENLLSQRQNAKEIRLYRLQPRLIIQWFDFFKKTKLKATWLDTKHTIVNYSIDIVNFILQHAYVVYLLYMTFTGKLNVGELIMLYTALNTLMSEIPWLMKYFTGHMFNMHYYAKLVMDFAEGESKEGLRDVYKLEPDTFQLSYNSFSKLELKNVSYQYPHGEKNAVENVNFSLRKGEIVSILGYNGSGKTTLSKLMSGSLKPKEGSVFLNDVNMNTINPIESFKYFGLAYQEFNRLSMTLKENIGVGMIEKYNDEEIDIAINKGNLKNIIEKLPNKENTLLGKDYDVKGLDLSGGEWQRIVLSRAYMGNPEVLVLDEPTASIDPMEEMRMLEHFREIIKGKTAVLISHRIGFARLADRIVMMEDGKIVEEGTHESLIKKENGYYSTLYSSQKELYVKDDINE